MARACILLLFSVNPSIIPLKQELVKYKNLCALSAPSSLDMVMIICNFFVISGENFLRIYKKAEDMDKWLAEADRLGLDEIISFANGLRKDLNAVKNAASHDYNNGLAEGSVNKLKLVKRKMYGRCSFETLRKKVLLQEQYKIIQQT